MGLMDRRQALLDEKAAGKKFEVEKNRDGVNATLLEERINMRWREGYELFKLHEAGGDTLLVWKRLD